MNETTATHASESVHFYDRDGLPRYTVMGVNGKERPSTLRDARLNSWCPSVTTILKLAAAPGLETWKQRQVLEAALTMPRQAGHSEEEWIAAILKDSQEQGKAAAERGTEIHAALEAHYGGNGSPEYADVCGAVDDALEYEFGINVWEAERSFASPLGFGGKADLLCDYRPVAPDGATQLLVDIKTKDAWTDSKRLAYDEHAYQLAAYREGLGMGTATCANVFVSRQPPWQVSIHIWKEADLQRGWRCFRHLLGFYVARTGYDPSWDGGVDLVF